MKRREFIAGLGGAAVWPVVARAQQSGKIPRVGVLWHAGSAEEEDVYLSVLVKAFNDLGYVEGKNLHLDHRFPAAIPIATGEFCNWLMYSSFCWSLSPCLPEREIPENLCWRRFQYPKFPGVSVQRPVAFSRRPVRIRGQNGPVSRCVDMAEKRGEPLLLPLCCGLPYLTN
jgi:hypothetical protein